MIQQKRWMAMLPSIFFTWFQYIVWHRDSNLSFKDVTLASLKES